jgi:hypothetical protein
MVNVNYDAIEHLFIELLDSVAAVFSEQELHEVREFIEANEYGIALQTFIDIVIEEKKRISSRAAIMCGNLACLMGLTEEVDLQSVNDAVL